MPTPAPRPRRPAPPRVRRRPAGDPAAPQRKPHSYGQFATDAPKPQQPQDAEELANEPQREEG